MSPEGQIGYAVGFYGIPLLIVCLWIRRWTRGVAERTVLRPAASPTRFYLRLLLKMSWRFVFVFVLSLLFVAYSISSNTRQPPAVGGLGLLLFLFVCPSVFLISSWTQTKRKFTVPGTAAASGAHATAMSATPPPLPTANTVSTPSVVLPVTGTSSRRVAIWLLSAVVVVSLIAILLFVVARSSNQAPTTVRGHAVNYSLQLPAGWTAKPGAGRNSGYDIVASSGDVHVGVVAENGTWGTTEAIAERGIKRQKTIMPDAQCDDPKPITIAGRKWVEFLSTGHNEGIPISMLAFVYSGPEGTFQVCGWSVQSTFDRSLPSVRRVMESFRFPEVAQAANTPSPAASPLPTALVAASPTHGQDLDYTIRFPADWTVKKKSDPYDILGSSRSLYIGIIAEKENLGSSAFVEKMAQKNITDTGATEVEVTDREIAAIDRKPWLGFVVKCLSPEKAPIGYQFYVYSGPEGTYQLIGWTAQNLFDREIEAARSIMRSFKFPLAAPELKQADQTTWKKVAARDLPCSLRIPPDWAQKPVAEDYSVIVGRSAIRVGIIAEEGNLGSPETLATIARKRIAETATAFEATQPQSLQLAGRRWLQFTVNCTVDKTPFTYQFYVYAGDEGSYQIVAWTLQDLFDANSAEIRQVMQTFQFSR
jgi:hypothetical protein